MFTYETKTYEINMNPKFIRYEKNNDADAKFLGIATISILDGKIVLRYKVQTGKNGGIFSTPFSAKQNEEWVSAFTLDSNIAQEEIYHLIKQGMSGKIPPANSVSLQQAPQADFDDSTCPF